MPFDGQPVLRRGRRHGSKASDSRNIKSSNEVAPATPIVDCKSAGLFQLIAIDADLTIPGPSLNQAAHSDPNSSACSSTVFVACSCLSGG